MIDRYDRENDPTRVVLVVEDDPPIAELLAGAINDEPGYVALTATDASSAMRALQAVNADCVVLDVELPGMSGLELYDQMQSDDRLRDLPVIVETASAKEHASEMRRRGIPAYIAKPFDLDDVVAIVKRLAPLRHAAAP